jgi:hypothetical protein
MSTKLVPTQDEQVLASLAHGSILLGIFTNGLGGHDFKYAFIGNWLERGR